MTGPAARRRAQSLSTSTSQRCERDRVAATSGEMRLVIFTDIVRDSSLNPAETRSTQVGACKPSAVSRRSPFLPSSCAQARSRVLSVWLRDPPVACRRATCALS